MSRFSEVAALFPDPFRLLWREEVGSTNEELRLLAEGGMGEGLVLVAGHQTAGRGRRGSDWFAPKGENLSFSVLLKPQVPKCFWSRLSLAAGLAVAEGLEKFIPLAGVKWPNDVMVSGKKIAGVLVEAGSDFVVVGIGINVNTPAFPDSLSATSLRIESGNAFLLEQVLLEVVRRLAHHTGSISVGFDDVILRVGERCCLSGKMVELTRSGKLERGLVRGIGKGGELLFETGGQLHSLIQADGVRVCG